MENTQQAGGGATIPPQKAGMVNPLLDKIEQQLSAQVKPESKASYEKAIIAGMKIMFDENTHANMELIKNPESRNDPVGTISKGAAGLMWLMYMQSKKTMKPDVLVLAGEVLMLKAFDFAERGMGIQITPEMIAQATKKLAEILMMKLGVSPESIQQAIDAGVAKQGGQQPQQPATGLLKQAVA